MGKLSLTFFVVGVAACGSDNNNNVDAHVVVPDTKPIDAPKVFLDAPPVTYDFACLGATAPATAPDHVTIAGTTQTIVGMAFGPLVTVTVESYLAGTATAADTQISAADGTFTTAPLATGAVPLDGYLKAFTPPPAANQPSDYRTTYIYPPNKLAANLTQALVPLISTANFAMLALVGVNQSDATNGFMLITVSDCTLNPITGASLTVKQGNNTVGTQVDLGQFLPAFAGIFAVADVPDGDVTIGGSYSGMTFANHVVHAYKMPNDAHAVGTITVSAVVPGWF